MEKGLYGARLSTYVSLSRVLRTLARRDGLTVAHHAPNGCQGKDLELDNMYFNFFDVLLLKNVTDSS